MEKLKLTVLKCMKISIIQMIMSCIFVGVSLANDVKGQEVLERRLNLDVANEKIKSILSTIEKNANVKFSYSPQVIKADRKTTFTAQDTPLGEVLNILFSQLDIGYSVSGNNIILKRIENEGKSYQDMSTFLGLKTDETVTMQSVAFIVTGSVVDERNQPLVGANVELSGTTKGTITDDKGTYKLELNEADKKGNLVFSYVGYEKQTVAIAGQNVINIMLKEAVLMKEVVVVGYGSVRKRDLTGAVVSVSSEEIKNLPETNIASRLQGRVAGLTITNSDTRPGESPNILIRGKNSITASRNPLIILDGIPYEGGLNTINPSDISTMNVLKDASSTAIYGSRGSNGVIIVTTKKGKSGKPTISYTGNYGINSILKKIDMLNADQYLQLRKVLGVLQPSEQANYNSGNITDWQTEATQKAMQKDHALGISGGGDKYNYYLGLGLLGQEGIVKGSEYGRSSFRFNGTYKVTNWLEIGTTNQMVWENWGTQGDVNITDALIMSPLSTPYNPDGTTTLFPLPNDRFFTNPLDILNTLDKRDKNTFLNNIYAEVKFPFLNGLSYKFNYGRTESKESRDIYQKSSTAAGFGVNGNASRNNLTVTNYTTENILNYDQKFGDHHVGFTGLYSFQNLVSDGNIVNGSNFINDNLEQYGIGSARVLTVNTPFSEWSLISQMARLNYDYKGRYFFTFTTRRDGYSGFGANNKFGVFPSLALGWKISDEKFLKEINWLSFLKLRTSYGTNGNQAIPPYGTLTQITGGVDRNYYFNNTALGFAPSSLGNPSLGWEKTTTLNFGVDFSVLNGRITGSIEYYNSKSKDLLLKRLLNSTQGFTSILQNIGQTSNIGTEINIEAIAIQNSNFSWRIGANFFRNKNTIVQLFDKSTDDQLNGWFIGQDIDANYNFIADGIFSTQAQIAASHMPKAKLGDRILRDVNQNGRLDDGDRAIQGRNNPDFTLGLNNTFSYKNFNLAFFIYTVQGVTTNNRVLDPLSYIADRSNFVNVDYWTAANINAQNPRPDYVDFATAFYQDRSFVRLKNITLSYQFDSKWVKKAGISNLGIYLTGNNLWTSTKWTGFDPESPAPSRIETAPVYPSFRTILVGLNLTF